MRYRQKTKKLVYQLFIPIFNAINFIFYFIYYNMQKGIVKFFNETKGFGFITPQDGGREIFVHSSGLKDRIRENDDVSFEVQQGQKGPNAVNVKLI